MTGDHMIGMSGYMAVIFFLVYIAIPVFLIWAVITGLRLLTQIAHDHRETKEALKDMAKKLNEK